MLRLADRFHPLAIVHFVNRDRGYDLKRQRVCPPLANTVLIYTNPVAREFEAQYFSIAQLPVEKV